MSEHVRVRFRPKDCKGSAAILVPQVALAAKATLRFPDGRTASLAEPDWIVDPDGVLGAEVDLLAAVKPSALARFAENRPLECAVLLVVMILAAVFLVALDPWSVLGAVVSHLDFGLFLFLSTFPAVFVPKAKNAAVEIFVYLLFSVAGFVAGRAVYLIYPDLFQVPAAGWEALGRQVYASRADLAATAASLIAILLAVLKATGGLEILLALLKAASPAKE